MKNLTQGNITKHLFQLALPTIGGMIAFAFFNITDTYFVGKLGTTALAAMGFTFPVVLFAGAIATGVSIGTGVLIARAFGNNDYTLMKKTATHGILLSIAFVALFSTIGFLTIKPLFSLLGANAETLPLVYEYMSIWYLGSIVVIMPPVCDGAMRAIGDTMRPFIVMSVCAILNIILDPILIFGFLWIPAYGVKGAAIATVISRFAGMLATLYFNHYHHHLIDWHFPKLKILIKSWGNIIHYAVPNIGVALLPQLIRLGITTLTASIGGNVFVAAVAAGSRIEGFVLIITMAISTSIVPLVGQNFGANLYQRVRDTQIVLSKTAIYIGLGMFILLFFVSNPIINLFTNQPDVARLCRIYILIVSLGSIGLNLYNFNSNVLNAIGQSKKSFQLNALGTIGLIVPLMYIGSRFSFTLMLWGLIIGQFVVGAYVYRYVKKVLISHINHTDNLQVEKII